jgi:hypothetical protein
VSDWFWEGNVQRAVVGHLVDEGWTIESETDTASRARADAIVVVGERGGIPLYLSWIRGEERYARA